MAGFSESDLIATFFAPLAGEGGLGLLDDAARLAVSENHELVVTTDAVVAGVHFFPDDAPGDIARKALRVNLSDLAAKGARPLGFLLTLGLPSDWRADWLGAFADALGADARAYHCPLVGGDTVMTPGPLTIAITAMGETPRGTMTPRTGARAGDLIAVTGSIGDAALGLAVRHARSSAAPPPWIAAIGEERAAALLQRYLVPQPRNALAEHVRAWARAAMDVSDGLVGDLRKMMAASKVSADVNLDLAPLSDAAAAALAADPTLMRTLFCGGDDYEVLMTLAPSHLADLERAVRDTGCAITVIGRVIGEVDADRFCWRGAPIAPGAGAFSHFHDAG